MSQVFSSLYRNYCNSRFILSIVILFLSDLVKCVSETSEIGVCHVVVVPVFRFFLQQDPRTPPRHLDIKGKYRKQAELDQLKQEISSLEVSFLDG